MKLKRALVLIPLLIAVLAVDFDIARAQENTSVPKCEGKYIPIQYAIPGITSKCSLGEQLVFEPGQGIVSKPIETYYVEDFTTYLVKMYDFFIGIVALGAVVMIMIGGMQYLLAAGNQSRIAGAKSTITSAVGGLMLALLSFVLLETINPNLTTLKLDGIDKVENVESEFLCAGLDNKTKKYEFVPISSKTPETEGDGVIESGAETKCGQFYYPREVLSGSKKKGKIAASSCLGTYCPKKDGKKQTCISGSCKKVSGVYGSIKVDIARPFDGDLKILEICEYSSSVRTTGIAYSSAYRFALPSDARSQNRQTYNFDIFDFEPPTLALEKPNECRYAVYGTIVDNRKLGASWNDEYVFDKTCKKPLKNGKGKYITKNDLVDMKKGFISNFTDVKGNIDFVWDDLIRKKQFVNGVYECNIVTNNENFPPR